MYAFPRGSRVHYARDERVSFHQSTEIRQFVKIADIDPLYFDPSCYSVPQEPGRRAKE